ncbi:hypothetical protein LDJ79_09890 [Vibrio tritonius]|uniref:Uncharacterized protein n=1 Tax=Vibrio tritonius TaxID=1435069 RepID=A0ABS7YMZ2_9VIBR|nr:hypothetical protein [Vibrio tritonius]MCA2016422.1 hypothetical protein [Vibrio tritonius]
MFLSILEHTPYWVWLIFLILLKIGYAGLSQQVVHFRRWLLFTLFIVTMSLYQLRNSHISVSSIIAFTFGVVLSHKIFISQLNTLFINQHNEYCLKGSKTLFIVLMLLFVVNYTLTVLITISSDELWVSINNLTTYITLGLFTCRAYELYRKITQLTALKSA